MLAAAAPGAQGTQIGSLPASSIGSSIRPMGQVDQTGNAPAVVNSGQAVLLEQNAMVSQQMPAQVQQQVQQRAPMQAQQQARPRKPSSLLEGVPLPFPLPR